MTALLELRGLCVDIETDGRTLRLVDDVSLEIAAGEAVGLVGESGSGKSMTAFATIGLFPAPGVSIAGGDVRLAGSSLRGLSAQAWRGVRGRRIGMVFQDPSGYLDPLMPVGRQIGEVLQAHGSGENIPRRVAELLAMMELPDPATTARRYPHELSGGMRQRVLIAAALAMRPDLLIADEPTTALDVTVQAGILDLLARLRAELGLGVLLITHDMAVVAQNCQRVSVMYAGRVVESADVAALFARPRHPYTMGLLRSTRMTGELFAIPGRAPPAEAMPAGCRFHPRCKLALPDPCAIHAPPLRPAGNGLVACWRADEAAKQDPWADEDAG